MENHWKILTFNNRYLDTDSTKKKLNSTSHLAKKLIQAKGDEIDNSKLYSYCIDKITIANEEITLSKLLEMEKDFKYLGYNNVSTIYGIDNMVIYKCNEINDYYITSRNIDINNNLCIKKDSKE